MLRYVDLQHKVTEPSCGNGNIANVLLSHGHEVDAYDLIDRGFGLQKTSYLIILRLMVIS